ncbi:MAG: nucleoside-diphosphate kinase [Alphaproteobacteria bacterium]
MQLTRAQVEAFYAVHKERPFFNDLCNFMISGPVVAQVLEGENAVAHNRELMGATNPADAAPGTIRKNFAESIEANSVHGSDAVDAAAQEISFFFSGIEIVG